MPEQPVQKDLLLAVTAPKIPATATQPRKNKRTLLLHSGFSIKMTRLGQLQESHCTSPD